MENIYAVIDVKAFYASFECIERNLNPFTTPLAVTDMNRKATTIVLSVSPYLKKMGVPSRCRRAELPKNIKNMIYATPQMEKYVKCSAKIVSIFLDYVGEDDIHVYSIDESFLNLKPYLKLYNLTAEELCLKIQKRIKDETGLTVTCGIGENMFLAKMADDKEAKNAPNFIATWTKNDVPTKLWPIKPLSEMWGISSGYQRTLNSMGIYSVYDLAHYPKDLLVKKIGVMGEELHDHANGIDNTNIRERYDPVSKNLSCGQVLLKDYTMEEAKLIIKEMNDDLCSRMRSFNLECEVIHLMVGYSDTINHPGFAHQIQLLFPTSNNNKIYDALMNIYNSYIEDYAIRRINITFSKFTKQEEAGISLFDDVYTDQKEENMFKAMDEVQAKFGKNKLLRTSSKTKSSNAIERHNQIGGHKK